MRITDCYHPLRERTGWLCWLSCAVILLNACSPSNRAGQPTRPAAPSPSAAPFRTASPRPVLETTPIGRPTAPKPTELPTQGVCSPLAGVPLERLTETVVNPFFPPKLGSDAPHQGVDLAELQDGERLAVGGMEVHAILEGQVTAVMIDRFPYGNAILVESRLDQLQPSWLDSLALPTPSPDVDPDPALTCPDRAFSRPTDPLGRSLYALYAHMLAPPQAEPGSQVACGQPIGAIGQSGNALNPHLHLEIRIGPAGALFTSMAHYDSGASPEEMAAYCLWRVSGAFQPIDPLDLFTPIAQP